MDGTAGIVTAEHLVEMSAGDDQVHATLDVGILSTTIDVLQSGDTTQYHCHAAILLSILAGTVNLLDIQLIAEFGFFTTYRLLGHTHRGTATYVTQGIRTTIDHMNLTGIELGHSLACSVVCIDVIQLVNTDIRSWVAFAGTVTTAKHLVDDVGTLDADISCRYGSSITTTIDILDTGLVTTFNNHFSTSRSNLGRIASVISFFLSIQR